MSLTYTFNTLTTDTAREWALQQVNEKHPVGDRDASLDQIVALYEYNRFGDIIDYSQGTDEEFAGGDPDYRED